MFSYHKQKKTDYNKRPKRKHSKVPPQGHGTVMKNPVYVHNELGYIDKYSDETVWDLSMDESHSSSRGSPMRGSDEQISLETARLFSHLSKLSDKISKWHLSCCCTHLFK